ncbi:MAG: pectin esterase, partial [Dysgonamonadaceae bacterium]|nr:pectin esterase [Dysgonamonadaceae bacterium]
MLFRLFITGILLLLTCVSGLANNMKYNIVVDRSGHGHFRNIQQAIDSVRAFDPSGTVTIFIRAGVYKE